MNRPIQPAPQPRPTPVVLSPWVRRAQTNELPASRPLPAKRAA